jgi:phosphatidylserine/phosphatidylglycerophosphate/cardiolipin synthase-like enzyme
MKYRLLAVLLALYALGTAYLWYGRPAALPILGAAVILPSSQNLPPEAQLRQISPQAPVELIVQPDDGLAPLFNAIAGATKSVDLVIYELDDTNIEQALCEAHTKGVAVRVLIENVSTYGKHPNERAHGALESCGVSVKWAPSYFALVHQKTLITDDMQAVVMTFNLMSKYYSSSRDFGIATTDPVDVAAIAVAFDADWAGQRTTAAVGNSLVWSPDSAPTLLALINSASSTLDVYSQLMSDRRIIDALKAVDQRGVRVRVVMTYATNWKEALNELTQAGVEVRTYASSASRYIHAKVMVADSEDAYVGSINFSRASLDANRELGILLTRPDVVDELEATFANDWVDARPYSVKN